MSELEASIAAGNRELLPVFDSDRPAAVHAATPEVPEGGELSPLILIPNTLSLNKENLFS